MNIKKEFSLIIGCLYKEIAEIKFLIEKLDENNKFLSEIICVISDINQLEQKRVLSLLKNITKIKLELVFFRRVVLPGEARNIGIDKSSFNYLCFLDSHTLPEKNWLSISIKIMEEKNLRGILGRTRYIGLNEFEKCFIAATFGNIPRHTLPGTLIEKKLINQIGFFIPNKRSGEDSEWIHRCLAFEKNIKQINVMPLNYIGLKDLNFIDLCTKWYKNYSSACLNNSLIFQRFYYLSFSTISIILIALSWNDKVAKWDENSLFYLPHISKITFLFILIIYILFRLIILPSKKNINFFKLNFFQFIRFSLISIILDIIKFIALITYRS
ncbi:glycosyltransferase [Prochlorococcus marinus]|uniref:glycosyltransferase n=1 Tax=Prochlorococcus marinus TaxID=1219 RepID=UPI001ADB13CB|nr:glycosyltransferase [Prochlorococcus marinus]MBO8219574.1 glycosyltransferase family 2 protein [Prochlorococcus marinus CUG1416]MBW3051947.1 hypothetical protein [Prochlorococcus marinus str. MU1416]